MTREEIAQGLYQHEDECPSARCGICGARNDDESHSDRPHCFILDEDSPLLLAAAELRKTCATCRSFKPTSLSGKDMACITWRYSVPADGSGFCHRWEAKS